MPSPVTPSQFADAIPANNADFCTRFTKWLNVPSLLFQFFSWMLDIAGNLSEEFKAEVATYSTPTGTVIYTLTQNVGTGFLECNGQAVSRTTYAALFNAIGTRFGAGDASTTFNLPDFRGRSPIGAGMGLGLTNRDINTQFAGEENHTPTLAETAAHSHEVIAQNRGAVSGGDGGWIIGEGPDVTGNQARNDAAAIQRHGITEESGGGQGFNVVHPCWIGYVWIKT